MVTNRRSLIRAAIAAIAALCVGKTAKAEPNDDLTAIYHEHFGGPGKTIYMDEATAAAWDELVENTNPHRLPGEPSAFLLRHYFDGHTTIIGASDS